ncbi:hypothetical protein [Chlorogloea sp. CCALA 695]|nr:hypothetical protein [Chlorogloea sp. CCALA 695]
MKLRQSVWVLLLADFMVVSMTNAVQGKKHHQFSDRNINAKNIQ